MAPYNPNSRSPFVILDTTSTNRTKHCTYFLPQDPYITHKGLSITNVSVKGGGTVQGDSNIDEQKKKTQQNEWILMSKTS